MTTRTYDIIVWGATGFTGTLVAEYLVKNGPKNLKFAIAGRSQSKLNDVLSHLASIRPSFKSPPAILADSNDQESLDAMVKQTKVILTTVGPYTAYGMKLVDACVRLGTDYVDLTGETTFVREIIDKYHDQAIKNNVLIVPSCGFDSIPSDLGTLLIADHFAKQGLKAGSVHYSVLSASGGFSGGTVASFREMLSRTPMKKLYEMTRDSNYLVPNCQKSAFPYTCYYDKDFKLWQTYFIMEMHNVRIVRRSSHLLGYGDKFNYNESMACSNIFTAGLMTTGIGIGIMSMFIPPTRWLISKLVPPGSGPTEEARVKGNFHIKLIGTADTQDQPIKVAVTVKGIQDPGYNETAKMISESAICLALDRAKLNSTPGGLELSKSGVVTPASAMGFALIDRLRKAGMTFEISQC